MKANESVIYYIMVYIKNINSAQTDTGSFNGTVFFNISNGNKIESDFSDKETLSSYITNLYTNASKTPVENNSIEYNYATDVSLMNDRLGGTTDSPDDGNIRYYGANPNNYIYFNCSDYNNQTSDTCELWRIIGIFDDKVKIMRNEPIGKYSWDTSSPDVNSGYGINEWSEADLMKLLNPEYESESVGGSLYYNSSSGTCYNGKENATTSCDFTLTGIKNEETKSKIAEVTWNLGGWNSSSVYFNQIYGYERESATISNPNDKIPRKTLWSGKIALPYPSDYGYAIDYSECTSRGTMITSGRTCTNVNWMYLNLEEINNGNLEQLWLLTPNSDNASYAYLVNISSSSGGSGGAVGYAGYTYAPDLVVPTLFLNQKETIIKGSLGTEENPYKLNP